MSFLEIRDLGIDFTSGGRVNHAVRGVNLDVDKGETVALVGESGSGKSVTALSALQLLPYPQASHPSGSIRIDGNEMIGASDAMLRDMRRRSGVHGVPGTHDLAQPAAQGRPPGQRDPASAPGVGRP